MSGFYVGYVGCEVHHFEKTLNSGDTGKDQIIDSPGLEGDSMDLQRERRKGDPVKGKSLVRGQIWEQRGRSSCIQMRRRSYDFFRRISRS